MKQMNHPPVVDLEKKAGCRYMLVTTVAKRARQLLTNHPDSDIKPVSMAIEELANDELDIKYPPEYFQSSEK